MIQVKVFWVVAIHQHFRRPSTRQRQQGLPTHWYPTTMLHGVTTQNTSIYGISPTEDSTGHTVTERQAVGPTSQPHSYWQSTFQMGSRFFQPKLKKSSLQHKERFAIWSISEQFWYSYSRGRKNRKIKCPLLANNKSVCHNRYQKKL